MGVANFEPEGKRNLDHFSSLNQGAGRHKDNSGPGALVPLQELSRSGDLGNCLPWTCVVFTDGEWDVGNDGMQMPAGQLEGNYQNPLLRAAAPVTVRHS